jgi:hypothetical protein
LSIWLYDVLDLRSEIHRKAPGAGVFLSMRSFAQMVLIKTVLVLFLIS